MPERPLVTVVETNAYLARARRLMSEDEREAVKVMVAGDPECGVVMQGTGGIRKVRVGLQGRGKSGGARVVYFYYDDRLPVFLLTVFGKNEKANISRGERNVLARLVQELKAYGEK